MKAFRLVAFLLVTLIGLTACGGEKDPTWFDGVQGETVATVNGRELKDTELDAISAMRQQAGQSPLPAEQAVQEIVNLEVLREAAVNAGFLENPEVVLQLNRQTTQVLASAYLRERLENTEITDAEIQEAYETELTKLPAAEYNSRHILLENEADANAVIAELNGGADFATLAQEKSIGPSGPNGGSLGWAYPEAFVPSFSAAMTELEVGAYSKTAVQTQFGWHVILLEDKRSPEAPNLEDIKPQIRQFALGEKIRAHIDSLREAAEVIYANDNEPSSE